MAFVVIAAANGWGTAAFVVVVVLAFFDPVADAWLDFKQWRIWRAHEERENPLTKRYVD